jgi:D-glycero-D-manno-heptose 1,7-bisphosphate phosphatase
MTKAKAPAVFLDRDGTLMKDVDYCGDPKDVQVFEGASEALQKLKQLGFKLVVITNQSGIARGYFDEQQYKVVEREVARQLGEELLEATYYCPHHPNDGCQCRKPNPELVVRAATDHAIDLSQSFFIGDKASDIECGSNAGVRTVLVRTGYGRDTGAESADFVAENLSEAADIIVQTTRT